MDVVAFFFENISEDVVEHSRFFRVTGFDRCPACDSFETGFVDGTELSFLELVEDLFEWGPFAGLLVTAVEKSLSPAIPTTLLSMLCTAGCTDCCAAGCAVFLTAPFFFSGTNFLELA